MITFGSELRFMTMVTHEVGFVSTWCRTYADIYEMIWLAHFCLGVYPGQLEGDDHSGSGCCDHCSASCTACSYHHWHHLCTEQTEEPRHLLYQPTAHQRQWQTLGLLLWQGEKGIVLLYILLYVCIVCVFSVFFLSREWQHRSFVTICMFAWWKLVLFSREK